MSNVILFGEISKIRWQRNQANQQIIKNQVSVILDYHIGM